VEQVCQIPILYLFLENFLIILKDSSPCASSPCLNGGTCSSFGNSFSCNCQIGFSGTFCQTSSLNCQSSPCLNGATCTNVGNALGYTCRCAVGFSGINCQTSIVFRIFHFYIILNIYSFFERLYLYTKSLFKWGYLCS
jgi:hypothetical protein